ncbi:hypothetical protein HMI56_004728 [Coelomomyces lativittatus]|nr:hypothetical protein HMI56_004728 [Coelomomyces lativittatus]
MLQFIVVLLLSKVAFICNESVTALKLLEKGIQKEDLGLAVLIDFPFQILFGYFAAQWSNGHRPLKPWLYAFYGRLLFAAIGMAIVYGVPPIGQLGNGYFSLVILVTVLSSFMSTVQFVSLGAFFSYVADPLIGGTYITLLNTCSNFGGTWPRYFILEAVDAFSVSKCTTTQASCTTESEKMICAKSQGECIMERDGYYSVGILSVLVGIVTLVYLIYPKIRYLEKLPSKVWKIRKSY